MTKNKLQLKDKLTEFLLYTTPVGKVKVEIFFHDENIWLTQKRMAELFGVNVPAISKHLNNIYESGELNKDSTVSILETVQSEGARTVKRYKEFYNLDAIISVCYRVNSRQATQFRIWATERLKEYLIKGFILDDERLKNGIYFGKDYFHELLERVRSIRASERRIYQQITDIFAECSIDYDPKSQITKDFMGLKTWKSAPDGRIIKSDTSIAKNYLSEKEIKKLERTVSGFFDYIENIIENRTSFTMEEFASSVNNFLEFNEYKVLTGKGSISAKQAEQKAFKEYDEFSKIQKIVSDFDKQMKRK